MKATSHFHRALDELWQDASRAQRFTYFTGLGCMITGILFLIGFLVLDGAWSGPTGFRSPIVFGLSAGMTLLSMAWLLHFFPSRPRLHAALMIGMSVAMINEIIIIDSQWFRGVPAHFNIATGYDGTLWVIMALSIAVFVVLALIMGALSWGKLSSISTMSLAIRLALVFFAFSQFTGLGMVWIGFASMMTGENMSFAATRPAITVIGEAGNLLLTHAITLHAIQALPLLGWGYFQTGLNAPAAPRGLALSGLGFTGLTWVSLHQALIGRAATDLSTVMAALGLISLLCFGVPYLRLVTPIWRYFRAGQSLHFIPAPESANRNHHARFLPSR